MKPAPEPEWCLRGHRDAVSCVRFVGGSGGSSSVPRLLASGDTDGQLKLWDLVVQRPVKEWAYPSNDGILEIHGHAGDRELLTQSRDGRIRIWDLERLASGAEPSEALSRTIFTDAFHFARCSVASPSSSESSCTEYLVLTPCEPMEAMCLWDTRAETYAQKLDLGEGANLGMVMSAKLVGSTLAVVGYESGDIIVFDLVSSKVRARRTLFESPVMGLDTDGSRLYAAGVEPKARVCKIDGDQILTRGPQLPVNCEATEHAKDGVGQLMLRPDGKLFATAGWDYRLRLFSTRSPNFKPLAVLRYHGESINAIAFSSDSTILAAGSKDFKISLWSDLYPPSRRDSKLAG